MPPPLLIDPAKFESSERVLYSREQIYSLLPHDFEFKLLDGVTYVDHDSLHIVAFHDVKPDAWWCRGHVPGKPILPGVLMLEMAAQTAAVLAKLSGQFEGFIAYGGVEDCRFREPVTPPSRLQILSAGREHRSRRIVSDTQGVVDGRLVFEARVTGMVLR